MKKIILTQDAPAPIGPYSQAVQFQDLLYISGQIALDPESGQLVLTDIETETRRVLDNMQAILKAGGTSFEHVIKVSVFVKDMNMFSRINTVYAEYFKYDDPPARELVEVVNLPRFVNIEISAIAFVPKD